MYSITPSPGYKLIEDRDCDNRVSHLVGSQKMFIEGRKEGRERGMKEEQQKERRYGGLRIC